MAISFNQQKGSAQKSSINTFQYKDGDNKMRIVGDILARYVYWIEGENGKNIPLECLSFDRNAERFTNKEQDWVREYYPDLKCGWSYATQCIDNGEVKVVNLKKKLWEQIITAAEDLGDPTDHTTGWDICFKRVKTGPLPYNVEYQLQALKCCVWSKMVGPWPFVECVGRAGRKASGLRAIKGVLGAAHQDYHLCSENRRANCPVVQSSTETR